MLFAFRFVQWLDRLASVGMRESVAYGLWNLSFMSLYRMTQVLLYPELYNSSFLTVDIKVDLEVLAVFLGGISIVTGCVSAEQLTKYILYCEWLIYAAWRVQDNMSSLLQSVGACEKVFQLMHLNPSCEFLSKGRGTSFFG
ncbi:hypothetical protein RD792_004282 [Penstemon davidsonii]|uniref:Uncharacterized protein n=1 Tax=Penstemon davidsonii TaxID=160366 RepID=A0ABR0DI62_9LAMI|nr:hypothetical protein RD792_004282 [Penstemon davidsonii]